MGFRYFVRREAEHLGLVGTVRNHADGAVEVVAHGDDEALSRLEERLAQGPPAARVDESIAFPSDFKPTDSQFRILF